MYKRQLLLNTPAAKRFVSIEPMLGPVDLTTIRHGTDEALPVFGTQWGLDWVIAGGESGPNARPSHPDWFRGLRDQCKQEDVPFFFKQWGEWAPNCLCHRDGPCQTTQRPTPGKLGCMFRCGKKAAGHLLDGVEWRQVPEVKHA